jgi:crossover junction endodeoxyribonuclease RuvC
MLITLGIDVGVTGAVAALDERGELVGLEDLVIVRDHSAAWVDGPELLCTLRRLRGGNTARAFIERLQAMPPGRGERKFGGSRTAISRGLTLGSTLATLQISGIGGELITPMQWKRALGLKKEKDDALDRARLMYPTASLDRKKDHNRAEALLIAHYGQRFKLKLTTR